MSMYEKVLKGLAACIPQTEEDAEIGCNACPYNGHPCGGDYQDYVTLPVEIIEDVRALLKAQEPRVMHVDEIQEFSTVWLEDVDKPGIIPAIYLEPLCGRLGFIQPGRGMIYPKADQCGKRWRPWTSRPTDEQRKVVKWE